MATLTRVESHSHTIFIGSREGYNGKVFELYDVIDELGKFQKQYDKDFVTLRVERCFYVAGDYNESGFSINAINYPRFPKTRDATLEFMEQLTIHLLKHFKQNRVTLVTPYNTYLFESNEAEVNPS